MSMFFIFVGLSIYYRRDPVERILKAINPSGRLRVIAPFCYLICIAAVSMMFSVLYFIRVGGAASYDLLHDVLFYLELPLINLETQCALVGLGPYEYSIDRIFQSLLPYKVMAPDLYSSIPRLESTIGAGFFGMLHWYSGPAGIVIASFCFGLVSQFFYARAQKSVFFLLSYCQISWALLVAHSHNHFLNLVFVPAPLAAFFLLSLVIRFSPYFGVSPVGRRA